jgi:prepilin-type N-terminal cleavage/methylation domain-containing protein
MKFLPSIREPQTQRRRSAFTLPEMLVSSGIGGIVLAAVAALSIFSSRSFVAIENYMDLDRASRNALDQLTREIRQTIALTGFATNELIFTDFDTNTLRFAWSPVTKQLTRTKSGTTKVLLAQCDYLSFNISQRNPIPGQFNFYPATNTSGVYTPSLCKLVDVSWRCSRQILQKKVNTESVQTAKIVLRN